MASTTLYPGFRFHPTDVELIAYYLKRKVLGRKLCVEAISEINIYKFSPWDLPDKSCIKSKDLEWYFFCPTERKYAKGGRINRSAENGYWKPSGKDRSINYKGRIVGMVKTLIFHQGHPPHGQRTDWVMHEYRMQDQQLGDSGVVQDAFVLCKLFHKDGPGPRNSAQYGATFEEEEWDDETFACGETFPFGCSFVATAGATQLLATTSTSELTNIGGPEVSSIWPGQQDRPSEPKQGVGNSLMEDIDIESLWASFMEEDIPLVQSDGHENLNDNNIDNPASDVAFAENDTYRGLPDLYIWPPLDGGFFSLTEMQPIQPFPDCYLELNDLNNPLNFAEDSNIMEHMLSENYSDLNFGANGYCLGSTQVVLQTAGGPNDTENRFRSAESNQDCFASTRYPLMDTGHRGVGDLLGGGASTTGSMPPPVLFWNQLN